MVQTELRALKVPPVLKVMQATKGCKDCLVLMERSVQVRAAC
jgi:hypothetical protein